MMPPLPEPTPCGYIAKTEYFYTEDQLREYGNACIAAEREKCAKVCEAEKWESQTGANSIRFIDTYNGACDDCADKIRSGT